MIAYNQALIDRSKDNQPLPDTPGRPYNEPASQPILIEDNERMDIIGQNGNDGLHYDDIEPSDDNNPEPKLIVSKKTKPPTAKGGVRIK